MLIVDSIWWVCFWVALGLCVGSFLNVVIYRIPNGMSIRKPSWSFCPHCNERLKWYDNLPLFGYLGLGGRGRCCGKPISPRYPLVEVAMAFIVLMLLDAFFIGRVREGLYPDAIGITWRLAEDWPIFLAHIVLFACLFAMAAIDMEHYWIDSAFATIAVVAGFMGHALWTPRHSFADPGELGWPRPSDTTAVVCLAACVGLIIMGIVARIIWRKQIQEEKEKIQAESQQAVGQVAEASQAVDGADILEDSDAEEGSASQNNNRWGMPLAVFLGLALLCAMIASIFHPNREARLGDPDGITTSDVLRYALPLFGFLILILRAAAVSRESDTQIIEEIEEESPYARKMAMLELAWLSPAIILGVIAWWLMSHNPDFAQSLTDTLHWHPTRQWQPIYGISTAASGYVIGAGIGWAVRILGTLAFGKEAFGDGDIHLMAATGCVAGWPVVVLGFVVTCVIALAGWILALPFKRTRAIPLVPWLALAFLITVVFYQQLVQSQPVQNVIKLYGMLTTENSQFITPPGL